MDRYNRKYGPVIKSMEMETQRREPRKTAVQKQALQSIGGVTISKLKVASN